METTVLKNLPSTFNLQRSFVTSGLIRAYFIQISVNFFISMESSQIFLSCDYL